MGEKLPASGTMKYEPTNTQSVESTAQQRSEEQPASEREPGETGPELVESGTVPSHEASHSDLAQSIPSNSSSTTTQATNQNELSDFSADR